MPCRAKPWSWRPGRDARPHANGPETHGCPFCPGHEAETPPPVLELALDGSESPWFVRVFPNLFPIVSYNSPR